MIKVEDVKRTDGRVEEVSIRTGIVEITFRQEEERLFETRRVRLDGARIYERETLHIPSADYNETLRTAHAIFKEKRSS